MMSAICWARCIPSIPVAFLFNSSHRIQGGFARCYLVSADGEEFALKSISRQSIRKESHWRKIRKEIAHHSTLRHPNIVALYSHFGDRDNVYMLLELCPMGTLGRVESL